MQIEKTMTQEEFSSNCLIIETILSTNQPTIYWEIDILKLELLKYDNITFKDDLITLIDYKTTMELFSSIIKSTHICANDSDWYDFVDKFKEDIESKIANCKRTPAISSWICVLAIAFRNAINNLQQINDVSNDISSNVPSVIPVQNQDYEPQPLLDAPQSQPQLQPLDVQTVDNNVYILEDFDNGNNPSNQDELEKHLNEEKQKLSTTEDMQIALDKEFAEIKEMLDKTEDEIDIINENKSQFLNKKKAQQLQAKNQKLSEEIKVLEEAYEKAKKEFEEYDAEYQIHKGKADHYQKLIKN